MRVQIESFACRLEVDTSSGGQVGGGAIPCHRCGICCERWQPLLTAADAARLAAHLGLTVETFHAQYTTAYPFDDEQRLLRRDGPGCVFLSYEREDWGPLRAGCAVHTARPQVCRDWAAGFDKKECVQGLERFAAPDGLIQIGDLYPDAGDRAAFAGAARVTWRRPAGRARSNRA